MKKIKISLMALLVAIISIAPVDAQTQQVLWNYDMSDGSTIHGMSDNGK